MKLIYILLVGSSTTLECYINHTSVETCKQYEIWGVRFSPQPRCYYHTSPTTMGNKYEHHKFGCVPLKFLFVAPLENMECYTTQQKGIYFNFAGIGRTCICSTDRCNNPVHLRKSTLGRILPLLNVLLMALAFY